MLFQMLGILLGCAVLCLHTVRVVARRTRLCPLTAEEVTVYLLTALELSGDEEKLTQGLLYTAAQLKECCSRRQAEQRQTAKLWLAGTLSAAGLLIILLI